LREALERSLDARIEVISFIIKPVSTTGLQLNHAKSRV